MERSFSTILNETVDECGVLSARRLHVPHAAHGIGLDSEPLHCNRAFAAATLTVGAVRDRLERIVNTHNAACSRACLVERDALWKPGNTAGRKSALEA